MKLLVPDEHKAEVSHKYNDLAEIINDMLIDSAQKKDGKLMMWCAKREATHVTGAGVAGCIEKISDIEITGRVSWDEETIQREVQQHERMIGQYVD